jgi:hypothetical protein
VSAGRPLLHTAEETAVILGGKVKPSWLREKARLREIPYTMAGGAYHWSDADIEGTMRVLARPPVPAVSRATPARRQPVPVPGSGERAVRSAIDLEPRIPPRVRALQQRQAS